MSNAKRITKEQLTHQVAEYTKRQPLYKTYADALKRVLERACKAAFPDAFVQAREKAVTSFAEKCVRKYTQYPNAVDQMNDLCGGRIIVQTLAQVEAVKQFIESGFEIVEADEKGLNLGSETFGYRDMHYVVRLRPDKAAALGFDPDEIANIGNKTAEIQVRTWVQHAWADTLHDRMYKSKLKYPAEFKRTGALLAAIMEDGDRAFNQLANDIDGMLVNFNAYASAEAVENELYVQELILAHAHPEKKPGIALRIARLMAPQGDYARVIRELSRYTNVPSPLGGLIRLELGYALCKEHRTDPLAENYRQGLQLLHGVAEQCAEKDCDSVPDLRQRVGTRARALARLAWSYEAIPADMHKARTCYRTALELEPDNPYYLADVIGHEINYARRKDVIGGMTAHMRKAVQTCLQHITDGTEMPFAAFTAARLLLLLQETAEALGFYARGIRHVLACAGCVPEDVFDAELQWLVLVTQPEPMTDGYCWATALLRLASTLQGHTGNATTTNPHSAPLPLLKAPILIVAGGAATLTPEQARALTPILSEAFKGFNGSIISGGTCVGVPGCVGEAADRIAPRGERSFNLLGYLPRVRPGDAPGDERYDDCIACGENSFTPEQILCNWTHILAAGFKPGDVRLLGFGGGPLSAVEYRIALGLGAWVGIVEGSGGAAESMLKDPIWTDAERLLPIPFDPASIRALAHPPRAAYSSDTLESMAMAFHDAFVSNSTGRLPDNMKPWAKLNDSVKTANLEQAKYAIQILESCGFMVRPVKEPKITVTFTSEEIEYMAEMEHGRWNVERLRNGWRPGEIRNDQDKIHDCLLPWNILPDGDDGMKKYDRQAVARFPEILAKAGLEVQRGQ